MIQINIETAHKMFNQMMERFDRIEKMIDGRTYYKASEIKEFFEQKGLPLPANLKNNPNC